MGKERRRWPKGVANPNYPTASGNAGGAAGLTPPLPMAFAHPLRPADRLIVQAPGEVAEWSNVRDWKSRVLERVPRVRIPPSPAIFTRAIPLWFLPKLDVGEIDIALLHNVNGKEVSASREHNLH